MLSCSATRLPVTSPATRTWLWVTQGSRSSEYLHRSRLQNPSNSQRRFYTPILRPPIAPRRTPPGVQSRRKKESGDAAMKRFMTLALLAISISLISVAQTSTNPQTPNAPVRKSPLAAYAGAWIGMFEGHSWMSIRLNLQAEQISGSMQRAHDFKFNNNGGLLSVSQDQVTEGIESGVLQGDGLLLTVKDPDTHQASHYVLRLTGPDTAELKMVAMSMPPGMPKPLPWKLNRVGASTATTAAPAH